MAKSNPTTTPSKSNKSVVFMILLAQEVGSEVKDSRDAPSVLAIRPLIRGTKAGLSIASPFKKFSKRCRPVTILHTMFFL
jgi:hypothetical protein